jgi:hypothetical protein
LKADNFRLKESITVKLTSGNKAQRNSGQVQRLGRICDVLNDYIAPPIPATVSFAHLASR